MFLSTLLRCLRDIDYFLSQPKGNEHCAKDGSFNNVCYHHYLAQSQAEKEAVSRFLSKLHEC